MALPSQPPISLTQIQTEFGAGSLTTASDNAGLVLPTSILDFLGRSASTTLTVAPSSVFDNFVGSPGGWDNLGILENRIGYNSGSFAQSQNLASVSTVGFRFDSGSAGYETIPTNATVNSISVGIITSGCCGGSVQTQATSYIWNIDSLVFAADGFLGGLGSSSFLSVNNQHYPLTGGGVFTPNDFSYASLRLPLATPNERFIDYWNSGSFQINLSGANDSAFGDIVKRNEDPNKELRIYAASVEINYSFS